MFDFICVASVQISYLERIIAYHLGASFHILDHPYGFDKYYK